MKAASTRASTPLLVCMYYVCMYASSRSVPAGGSGDLATLVLARGIVKVWSAMASLGLFGGSETGCFQQSEGHRAGRIC